MCVIDGRRGQHLTSNFLDLPYPVSSFRGRRGEQRGTFPRRQFGQRGFSQVKNLQFIFKGKNWLCKSNEKITSTHICRIKIKLEPVLALLGIIATLQYL